MADLPDYYVRAEIDWADIKSFAGGLDANKSDTPVSRDIYLATDTHILYVCFVDDTWTGFDASILTQGILTLYANMLGGGFQIKNIADPTLAQDAATRAYVLARCGLYLPLTGGTMSGDIAMGNNIVSGMKAPTADGEAARKKYVDDLVALYLLLTGGTLTGNLTMGAGGLKIILADDDLIQLGTQDGSPELFAGNATYPHEVFIQAKDGNRIGELGIYPKGTQDSAVLELSNDPDQDNPGFVHLIIDGLNVILQPGQVGTGVEPTNLYIKFPTLPHTNLAYGLGDDTRWWSHVNALHHHILSAVNVTYPVSGTVVDDMTAGESLVLGDAVYMKSDGKAWKSDADLATTMPVMALAAETIAADASGKFLTQGFMYKAAWDWTIGGIVYASVTPGELSQTAPVGSGDQVQVVGVAKTADIIYFNPSFELVEIS